MAKVKRSRQFRVDDDVAALIERVAALQEPPATIPDFLSRFLRPLLRRELQRGLARIGKQLGEKEDEE